MGGRRLDAGGLEGVLDDGFEDVDVFEEPAPAVVGEPAEGLGAVVVESLPDLDEAGLVQDLEVPAEVAVGEVAEFLQVGEDDAARVGDQRRHDPQPGLLVEDALEALVGEPAGRLAGLVFSRRHGRAPGCDRARRRPGAGPRRRAGPWPRGTAPHRRAPGPARPARSPGRRPRPRRSPAAAAGTRRRSPG